MTNTISKIEKMVWHSLHQRSRKKYFVCHDGACIHLCVSWNLLPCSYVIIYMDEDRNKLLNGKCTAFIE